MEENVRQPLLVLCVNEVKKHKMAPYPNRTHDEITCEGNVCYLGSCETPCTVLDLFFLLCSVLMDGQEESLDWD